MAVKPETAHMEPARVPDLGRNALRSATDLSDSTICCTFLPRIEFEGELLAMAMKPCKDCGEQASSRADECLHCGRMTFLGWLDYVSNSVLLLLLLYAYYAVREYLE